MVVRRDLQLFLYSDGLLLSLFEFLTQLCFVFFFFIFAPRRTFVFEYAIYYCCSLLS